MAKKKGGGGGGANWMDTYGDMVTLLLCFFVLLYSMSTISEEKFKAIVQSFNPNASRSQTEIIGGNDGPNADDQPDNPSDQLEIENMMKDLLDAIQDFTAKEGLDSSVAVSTSGGDIYMKFEDSVFFGGNSSKLRQEGIEILAQLCTLFDQSAGAIEQIRVQGHTAQQYDDRPNETKGDRELASARATNVVIFLQDNCHIHPARLVAESYGQWHAIADNQGEEGKAPNRRVELVINAKELGSELNKELAQYTTSHYTATQEDVAASAAPSPSAAPASAAP